MWIPDALYRKLPVIYAATGVALIPAFGLNGPSVLSAALLMGAGALTALWRFRHRQPPVAPALSPREEWEQRRAKRVQTLDIQ